MKKVLSIVLLLALLLICSSALASEFDSMVPAGTRVHSMQTLVLKAFDDASPSEWSSDFGLAAVYISALYDFWTDVDSSKTPDATKAAYGVMTNNRFAAAFCPEDGNYICLLYSPYTGAAGYYQMSTSDPTTARSILSNAMPTASVRKLSNSDISTVIDVLLDNL